MTALPPLKRPNSKRRMPPKALSCWWKFWGLKPKIAYFISIPWNSFFCVNVRVHQRGLSCPAALGSVGPVAGLFTLYPINSDPGSSQGNPPPHHQSSLMEQVLLINSTNSNTPAHRTSLWISTSLFCWVWQNIWIVSFVCVWVVGRKENRGKEKAKH